MVSLFRVVGGGVARPPVPGADFNHREYIYRCYPDHCMDNIYMYIATKRT